MPTLDSSTPAAVYGDTASNTSLVTASFTPPSGSIVVAKVICSDSSQTSSTPTGMTFASQVNASGSSSSRVVIYTATGAGSSVTVTAAFAGTAQRRGLVVEVYTSAALAGTPATHSLLAAPVAPSDTITTTGTNSYVVWANGDWWPVDGASRTYRSSATETAYHFVTGQVTIYAAYQLAAAAGSQTYGISAPSGQTSTLAALEVQHSGAAADIPYNPQRGLMTRDPGEAYFLQRDRRDANLVATAANPVNPPLDSAWQAGGKYWHLYNDWGSRRFYPQQRQYESPPGLLSTALLEDALLGGADDIARHRAWYTDRREVPQQRLQLADQGAVAATNTDPTQSGGYGPEWRRWRRDPIPPVQRALESPPGLLDTALLEDALLGGATTELRYFLPVTHADRREYPQQTLQESVYGLLDQALLEVPTPLAVPFAATHWRTIWQRTAEILSDQSSTPAAPDFDPTLAGYTQGWRWRRDWQMPAQRAALVDQSSTPAPATDFDPTQTGYSQNWRWYRTWLLPAQRQNFIDQSTVANDANPLLLAYLKQQTERTWPVDRREYPQQRQYFAALAQILENELLGGADDLNRHRTWYVSRRLVPIQHDYRSVPGALGALLENELLGGADDLLRHRTWYVDRREVPQQRSYPQEPPRAADPLLIVGQDGRHRLIPITHADRWVLRLQIHYLEFIGSTGFNVYPRQAGVILGGVGPAGGQASGNVYPYTAGGIIGQVG